MPPLLRAGFARPSLPTRTVREAAKGHTDPLSPLVSSGQVKGWDLVRMLESEIPGAKAWADKALDDVLRASGAKAAEALTAACTDCEDIGFYGLTSPENTDALTALLRRQGDNGYEQLTAAGTWASWEPRYDQQLEILTQELATDLAEAITAGASSLLRRYLWPMAFLPPGTMTAAAPAPELAQAAADAAEVVTAGPDDGWREDAVVGGLDPGAVLALIRLRGVDAGPELVAYRNVIWDEAPDVLSELQGVQPPPLVELDQAQLTAVLEQVGQSDAQSPSQVEGQAATSTPQTNPAPTHSPAPVQAEAVSA